MLSEPGNEALNVRAANVECEFQAIECEDEVEFSVARVEEIVFMHDLKILAVLTNPSVVCFVDAARMMRPVLWLAHSGKSTDGIELLFVDEVVNSARSTHDPLRHAFNRNFGQEARYDGIIRWAT